MESVLVCPPTRLPSVPKRRDRWFEAEVLKVVIHGVVPVHELPRKNEIRFRSLTLTCLSPAVCKFRHSRWHHVMWHEERLMYVLISLFLKITFIQKSQMHEQPTDLKKQGFLDTQLSQWPVLYMAHEVRYFLFSHNFKISLNSKKNGAIYCFPFCSVCLCKTSS